MRVKFSFKTNVNIRKIATGKGGEFSANRSMAHPVLSK